MTLLTQPADLFQRMAGRDLLSIRNLSREDIEGVLDYAESLRLRPQPDLLRGCLLGSCFFEPSTRTRLSFEAAIKRLGGDVIGFAGSETTSTRKGETLQDSMKIIGSYVDAIVIRHPLEGAARQAADATETPVINAGDGANQHPTQTLLDLFTIRASQGRLDGLHVACVGDLRYSRTIHSLIQALSSFGVRLYFVAPPNLELPFQLSEELKAKGILFSLHPTLESVIPKIDVLYMTRLQQERTDNPNDIHVAPYVLRKQMLRDAKQNLRILAPLPRRDELPIEIDASPHAFYFEQATNGLYVRQALLSLVLGKTKEV